MMDMAHLMMEPVRDLVSVEHLVLERLKFQHRGRVSLELLRHAPDVVANEISYAVYMDLMGDRSVVEDTERVPASWWDHVKERFFPAVLLRRYPVIYREIQITTLNYKIYPNMPLCEQQFGRYLYSER